MSLVSILVVMENALGGPFNLIEPQRKEVSILVVMENALGAKVPFAVFGLTTKVSILVVMENALGEGGYP